MPADADLRRQLTNLARERDFRRLGGQYRPVLERLTGAYNDVLPGLVARVNALPDALGPNYPNIITGANQDAIEGLIRRVQDDLGILSRIIAEEAPGLQAGALEAGVRNGIAAMNAGGMNVQFNRVFVEAVQASVNYVDSPVFQLKLREMAAYHGDKIRSMLIVAQATGTNPRTTARMMAEYFTSRRPLIDADNWARTTQIYSLRQGTRSVYEQNGIREWIWSAALDDRTCLACIAMHGTRHPVTEVLNDHHRGRCAMVPVTPTWADLGFDDGQEPRYETGVDWFSRQSPERQAQMMGPQLYQAWQAGLFEFNPRTIVGTYQNDIFGEMRRRRSNWDILGGRPPSRTPTPSQPPLDPNVTTMNGVMRRDQGRPGSTEQSLLDFVSVNGTDSPLSAAMWDQQLVDYDDNWRLRINRDNVRDAAKAFVVESRDIQYGRDYLLDMVRDQAARNGVTGVSPERLMNEYYATRADAIRTVANISNVRLTTAQQQRLARAIDGQYLDMVYTTNTSVNGSLANRMRTTSLSGAELDEKRREFMEYVQGIEF